MQCYVTMVSFPPPAFDGLQHEGKAKASFVPRLVHGQQPMHLAPPTVLVPMLGCKVPKSLCCSDPGLGGLSNGSDKIYQVLPVVSWCDLGIWLLHNNHKWLYVY